jgi:hypothetical protein
MTYEHRELSGSLFENEDRTDTNNQPHFRGKALIGGVLYNVSSWRQTSRSGIEYQSLSFKPAAKPDFDRAAAGDRRDTRQLLDDDLPF